jgi:anti-sigma factor RsiW
MTEPPRPVQEDDLHAYVDGRLDAIRRTEVERHLRTNTALQRRVEGWHLQAEALRDALSFRLDEPVPSSLHLGRLLEQRMARRQRGLFGGPWRIAAAMVLTLGVGAAVGWTARGTQRMGEVARLGMEAAAAHSVFGVDPARPIEIGPQNRSELVGWIGSKLHKPVTVPDLSPLGYQLIGGRVLSTMVGPAAMLVYDGNNGSRLTVFLQPMRSDKATMQPVHSGAANGYAWIDAHMGYSVISDGESSTQILADRVRREMTPER